MIKSIVIGLALSLSAQAWAKPAVITALTPQNLSETTNQIRAVFSEKMVALGVNPNAEIFDITCSPTLTGVAHWDDEKSWVFDFKTKLTGNKLPGGTRCQVKLKANVKNFAGDLVSGKKAFSFQVDGPNIIAIYPGEPDGRSVSTVVSDQVFAIGLDADVDQASVLKNAYFKVEGIASNVQIRILPEADKLALMKAQNFPRWRFSKDLPLLMVQAKTPFPENKKVSLVWGKGITSAASGLSRQARLVLPYATRPMLQAAFSCERENAKANCSPFSDMTLDFNAPIPADLAKQIKLVGADGKEIHAEVNKGASTVSSLVFTATVQENQTYKLSLPTGLVDENGRKLSNQASFPLTVKTSDFPPLAKFSGDFGIIEANVKPILLPATLRNLEAQVIAQKFAPTDVRGSSVRIDANNFPAVVKWMKKLDVKSNRASSLLERDRSIFSDASQGKPKSFKVPVKAGGKTFEVVGIPLDGPGFYVVELQSRLLGRTLLAKESNMYVPTGALVTNMVVHSKWGKENSLFWVTALDSGAPIAGAQVAVYDCGGRALAANLTTNSDGIATLSGDLSAKIDPMACAQPAARRGRSRISVWQDGTSKYDHGFFVSAQKDGDFTFTHSGWTDGIEYWRFGLNDTNPKDAPNNTIAHTILDRTLLRAGEVVSMKHVLRLPSLQGLAMLKSQNLPNRAYIEHTDTGTRYVADLKWDANGTAVTQFAIPKDAKLGLYAVTLVQINGQNVTAEYLTSTFQVMEFKVPQMKGMIAFPANTQQLVQPGKLDAQVSVTYQDGGPVPNKPVTFRYTVSNSYGVSFDNYKYMSFGANRVVEKHGPAQSKSETPEQTVQLSTRLDGKGSAVVSISGLSGLDSVKTVTAMLEFTDSNAESQNITRTVNVYPAGQLVAIAGDETTVAGKTIKFKVAVVDLKGQAIVGVAPSFQLFEQIVYTHKTMMVGGFYQSESFTDINPLSANFKCDGTTDKQGMVVCETTVPQSGDYMIQAEVRDAAGNSSYASTEKQVSGTRRAWYPSDNNDRMDLIADQPQVQSGQDASITVKMPFDQATVLVTIEREGVLDAFVVPNLSTENPVIKVRIKPEYAPNVYVSALAVRGRITGTGADSTATVDLGKPAYKLGLAALNVNWKDHELKVAVKPSKATYKPREMASVDVTVTNAAGQPVPNAEFAFAVVDKGLLELAKNGTWNLLQAMMGKRSLSVETATAQMQVIGKRHYGLKAKPTGGDGGSAPTRELFDTLIKWEARVLTNANGVATVKFPMNDSLTAFQVVAVAQAGADKFGTGQATITAQQDIVIIPAVSQLARNGDTYAAEFTLRNTTNAKQCVALNGRATFTYADAHTSTLDLPPVQPVCLEAQESQFVTAGDIQVPEGVVSVKVGLAARDPADKGAAIDACVDTTAPAIDKLCISQKVQSPVAVRTWMAQLSRVEGNLAPVNVTLPPEALANQGGVKVSLLASLTGGLTTVQDSLINYPFISLEYLVSSAVARNDQATWDIAMKKLPAYLDAEGLVLYYPSGSSAQGSDVLTAYILSVANYSGLVVPQDAQDKMLAGLKNFVQGKSHGARGRNEPPVDTYIRRVNAIEVLARYNEAQATWLSSLPAIAPTQVPTSSLINLLSIYTVLKTAPDRQLKLDQIHASLQARLTRVGTGKKLTPDASMCWYCMSSIDTDQLRLILVLSSNKALSDVWVDDAYLLVQAAVGMMNRGAWDLTVADAYGVLAMKAFSTAFEKQKVTGLTTVNFPSAAPKTLDWNTSPKGGVLDFGWPGPGTYSVGVSHQGTGTPWAIVAVNAAVPLKGKVEQHISITKELNPVKTEYHVGDVVTVTLNIKAQTSLSQVSLVDPIPASAKIQGTGLDNDGTPGPAGMYPDEQELANDGYHASYGLIPADNFHVVYRMRLNNAGTFKLPSTRVEAIYAPENFAEAPNADITVKP